MVAVFVFLLLAASVLPFGAVHAWALYPVLAASAVGGFWIIVSNRKRVSSTTDWPLATGSVLLITVVALQLAPLPSSRVGTLTAATVVLHVGSAETVRRSITVSPDHSVVTIGALVALGLLGCGLAAALGQSQSLQRTCRNLAVLAVLVAVFALTQKATSSRKIYWFWESEFRIWSNYFGPFVNRNHFAGWMMLSLSVSLAFLCGQVGVAAPRLKPGWRDRVLWLSSPVASHIVLTAAACLVMLISLIWSMSRSGIIAATLACAILGVAAARRMQRSKAFVASGLVALLLLTGIAWKGVDTLAGWYGRTNTFEWRLQLWKDSLAPLRDFWFTGSGLNTYGVVMLFYPRADMTVHPQQAHNDYLQLAIEGGLLVGVPVLILIGLFIREVRRRLRQPQDEMTWWIRMGAVAGICGMAVQETVEFSLQIPGVAVLFAVLVAIAIHEPAPVGERTPDFSHAKRRREMPAMVQI
jgi:O-antigen ligase